MIIETPPALAVWSFNFSLSFLRLIRLKLKLHAAKAGGVLCFSKAVL